MSATAALVSTTSDFALSSSSDERSRLPLLTIVIPALNEEESIGHTVQRCLDARPELLRAGGLRDIELIIVNDGSTDRTSAIAHEVAARHRCVSVIDFAQNRGYGAALKEGFDKGTGELVSFLDADGTCDPRYFGPMCRLVENARADLVLGSRMGPDSQMPRVRRIGNRLFAVLLGFLSGRAVTDTASGMRVIRREALGRLYPLPDGLQFTPAMSARAILDDMTVLEVEMQYSQRVGESKLHAFRDGIRFLVAILHALLLLRPNRIFNLAAVLCCLVALAWGSYPAEFYLRHSRLEDWMIYRVLLCGFLGTCAFVFLSGGVVADKILSLVHRPRARRFTDAAIAYLFSPRHLLGLALLMAMSGCALVFPGLIEYARTGHTSLHWSRAIVAVFLLQVTLVSVVAAVLQCVLDVWRFHAAHDVRERGIGER